MVRANATVTIPNYKIKRVIGTGGFATVFEAKDQEGRTVALKVLNTVNENVKKQFVREVGIWKVLDHPNIVKLIGYGVEPYPYISMELMEGTLLQQLKEKNLQKKRPWKSVWMLQWDCITHTKISH